MNKAPDSVSGAAEVHPTAILSSGVRLGAGVRVGPYCVIEGDVVIGDDTTIGPHTVIHGPTVIGRGNRVHGQSALGTDPQDLKFWGETTTLVIGDDNKIREFVTINRGTEGGIQKTVVGSGNLLMTGVHVAHDSVVGNGAILANSATLAGHVTVGDHATVGAFTGVHQFCRVGPHAFVGGYSVLTRDALPFVKTVGTRNQASIYGINRIGLERRGFSPDSIAALQGAYKKLFGRGLRLADAIRQIRSGPVTPEVEILLNFIETAERGFVRSAAAEE